MVEIVFACLRMRARSRLRTVALVGLFTVVALCMGAHANPAQSFKIVVTSNRFSPPPPAPSKWQIYIMDADGTHARRLTNLPDSSTMPALSPDGRTVAFTVYDQYRSIYLMNADGSNLHRLTTGVEPTFSPDGQRIVLAGWATGSTIHIVDVDGTHLVDTGQAGAEPTFSPDGRKILFTCAPHNVAQVCLMDQNGSHLATLTDPRYASFDPRFSPDGHVIVFASSGREVHGVIWPWTWVLIYMMNADGSNVHLIEDPSSSGQHPSFTPDGRVLFARRHVDQGPSSAPHQPEYLDMQICVMNADGAQEHCLTSGPWENGWRPFF